MIKIREELREKRAEYRETIFIHSFRNEGKKETNVTNLKKDVKISSSSECPKVMLKSKTLYFTVKAKKKKTHQFPERKV